MKVTGARDMHLTEAERKLIAGLRERKGSKLAAFAKQVLDGAGEPTGDYSISEEKLEALVDEITTARAHRCPEDVSGGECGKCGGR